MSMRKMGQAGGARGGSEGSPAAAVAVRLTGLGVSAAPAGGRLGQAERGACVTPVGQRNQAGRGGAGPSRRPGRRGRAGAAVPAGPARPDAGGAAETGAIGKGSTVPPKLYRVGEIVEHTGFSRQTIHNYTTMGLITELRRTAGGHRLYGEDVFARLAVIAELKRQSKCMREIRGYFEALNHSE